MVVVLVIEDRLLTADEVADLLSVPLGWVREHTRSGELPHVQLGRYRRYHRGELLKYIEAQAAGGDKPLRARRRPLRAA